MLSYIELLRPTNCFMSSIAVFIGGFLAAAPNTQLLLSPFIYIAMISSFIITGAGNVINDYIDIDADKINKPGRPLPSGRVSPKGAFLFSILLFFLGIFLSGFVNYIVFFIALFNSILLVIYSLYLQDKILMGNISVSYLVASTFLFGGAVFNNLVLPSIFTLIAFFANLSREIIKDMEDMEGDKRSFLKRLTKRIITSVDSITQRFRIKDGKIVTTFEKRKSILTSVIFLIIAILLSPLPYIMGILSYIYIYAVIITDILFLYSIFLLIRKEGKNVYTKTSKLIKIGMFFGLLAFIIGAI